MHYIIKSILLIYSSSQITWCNIPSKDRPNFSEVRIGTQIWMDKNFDGAVFRNGDAIPHAKTADEWEAAGKAGKPAWCYYENDSSIGKKYGRIYNWYAISDPRGLSPKGWHVPTNDEWITLENFLGNAVAGQKIKCHPNGDNKFCLLLGGYRSSQGGFSGLEEFTYMSSSTARDAKDNDAWGRGIHTAENGIMRCGLYKEHGTYVRLIKD